MLEKVGRFLTGYALAAGISPAYSCSDQPSSPHETAPLECADGGGADGGDDVQSPLPNESAFHRSCAELADQVEEDRQLLEQRLKECELSAALSYVQRGVYQATVGTAVCTREGNTEDGARVEEADRAIYSLTQWFHEMLMQGECAPPIDEHCAEARAEVDALLDQIEEDLDNCDWEAAFWNTGMAENRFGRAQQLCRERVFSGDTDDLGAWDLETAGRLSFDLGLRFIRILEGDPKSGCPQPQCADF